MHSQLLRGLVIAAVFALGFFSDRYSQRPISLTQQLALSPEIQAKLMALPSYETVNEAAVILSARLYQCSHVYECSGVIALQSDGRYSTSAVRSDEQGDRVSVIKVVPPGWKIVADVHSHPCLPDSHFPAVFSPEDVSSATMHRTPGYMVNLCTGVVRVFDPTKDSPNDAVLEEVDFYGAIGRIVGTIPVDGKSVEPNEGR